MSSSPASSLARRLGWMDAAAIIVSNVIGGGILFTPPQVAASVQGPWLFLAVWLVGGVLALAGAMAYAELAVLRPRAGGEYVYLTAAYGRLAGFLTGWTSFVAGFSGAIAVSAVVLAALKVSALVLFIALGFAFGTGSMAHLQPSAGGVAATSWLLALIPVMFTYSGWNAAAYVAEEVREPARNLPLALGVGTLAVVAIYFFLNLLYLYVLPVGDLAAVRGSVLDVIAEKLLGARAGDVMGGVSIVSLAASISAMTFAGPRVYYAMARDGLFFSQAARVHPRFQTPALAIVAQAVWSGLLVLAGGASALIRYTGFALVLFAGVAVAAVFVLRRREPQAPRSFKAVGYPIAPALFTLVSVLIVVNAVYKDPGPSGAGMLVIAAGVPLYLILDRRRQRSPYVAQV